MDINNVKAMLGSAGCIKELLERLAANHVVQERLKQEEKEIEEELQELTGFAPARSRAKQKCKVCGSTEHNARFHKEQ